MTNRHTGACSGTFVLYCSKLCRKASCGWAELQVKSNNYRGKLLGAVGFLLVIRTVLSDKLSKSLLLQSNDKLMEKAYSNDRGVILHGNNPEKNLHRTKHTSILFV